MGLGFLGCLTNIVLGFGLTKDMAAASDQHLSVALLSLFFLFAGGIGAIRFSKIYLESLEGDALKKSTNLKDLQVLRQKAVTPTITIFVILTLSLISGTISQSGRFPLVHGLLGFSATFVTLLAIWHWVCLTRKW